MKQNLYLELNQKVKVEGVNYIVEGWIEFSAQSDGCSWREYRLRRIQDNNCRWLSIDENYDECAIYEMSHKASLFDETMLEKDGYKKVDSGKASVLDFKGNVDVDRGERVTFAEYEDYTEEKIRAIEYWGDEAEYSVGHYIEDYQIVPLNNTDIYEQNYDHHMQNKQGFSILKIMGIFAVIAVVLVAAIGMVSTKTISKYLASSSSYIYVTSITSDINTKQKADVYKTSLSVKSATENILSQVANSVVSVDENAEGGAVAILTNKEYALIYISENNETLVQVSNRAYVYSSRNDPYRCRTNVASYYRGYYYTKGYASDSKRYKNVTSGYEDYTDSTVAVDTSNYYKTYTNTIRQQSTAARSSSGGGTSSGK